MVRRSLSSGHGVLYVCMCPWLMYATQFTLHAELEDVTSPIIANVALINSPLLQSHLSTRMNYYTIANVQP